MAQPWQHTDVVANYAQRGCKCVPEVGKTVVKLELSPTSNIDIIWLDFCLIVF